MLLTELMAFNFVLKYRLSLERNLSSTLKWLILISQIFGAAPGNLSVRPGLLGNSEKSVPSSKRKTRLIVWIYHIWSIFIVVSIVASMYSRDSTISDTKLSVAKLLDLIEYLFNAGNVVIIMVGCNYQRNWYSQYCNEIIEIDIKLQRSGGKSYPCTLKRYLRNLSIVTLIFFAVAVIIECTFRHFIFFDYLRGIAAYVLPNIIVTVSVLQYYSVLIVVRERFGQIIFILQRMLNEHTSQALRLNYHLKGSVLAVISLDNLSKFPFAKGEKNNSFCNVPVEEILNSLREIFYDLNVINMNINQSFGILVLALTTSTFIIVCAQFYNFYKFATDGPENMNVLFSIYSALWVILHSTRVFGILYLNSKVEDEVIANKDKTALFIKKFNGLLNIILVLVYC